MRISIIFVLILSGFNLLGQNEIPHDHDHDHDVYDISWSKDIALLSAGLGFTIMGDIWLSDLAPPDLNEINLLNRDNVWALDRAATSQFSSTAETSSDIILYTAAALPFALYAVDNVKGEEKELLIMTIETFLITNGITNMVKAQAARYRPYNYNPIVPDDIKLSSTSRQSFFSGHASNTAAFSFLTAQALIDMHPHWSKKKKTIVWTVASSIPLAISYGRYKAGKHFPTDVITGYLFGATVGLIIPRIHRSENYRIQFKNNQVGLSINF